MKDKFGGEYEARVFKIIHLCYGQDHEGPTRETWVDENGECLFCGSKNIARYERVALVCDATCQNIKDPNCPN